MKFSDSTDVMAESSLHCEDDFSWLAFLIPQLYTNSYEYFADYAFSHARDTLI